MQIEHKFTVKPPFEVEGTQGTQIVDSEGSIVAVSSHMLVTEILVDYLNTSTLVGKELSSTEAITG